MNRLALLYQSVNRTIQTRSNLIIAALALIGLLRQVLVLLAYPPAHGADSMVYFLYAERFTGTDILISSETAYPLYPMLIWASFYALGTIYVLIAAQFVMAITIASLYFAALLPYQPIVALIASLIILFDFQTAIVFSFTSTEPVYIFLLAVAVWLCLKALGDAQRSSMKFLVCIGLVMALLLLTRPVGRFLVLPVLLLFFLRFWSLRQPFVIGASFAGLLIVQAFVFQALFDSGDSLANGDSMLANIMNANPNWQSADNGVNSAAYIAALQGCDDHIFYCLSAYTGNWDQGLSIISGAARETVEAHISETGLAIVRNITNFMKMGGQQYAGKDEPSVVQCSRANDLARFGTRSALMKTTWGWSLPNYEPATLQQVQVSVSRILKAMCPSLVEILPQAEKVVDQFADWIRMLDRGAASLLFAMTAILVLIIPQIRRGYFFPVALMGTFLLNHALISAVTFNVQPRYVVVTNPLRYTLLVFLTFFVMWLIYTGTARFRHRWL